jgi:hypothetical protein
MFAAALLAGLSALTAALTVRPLGQIKGDATT